MAGAACVSATWR